MDKVGKDSVVSGDGGSEVGICVVDTVDGLWRDVVDVDEDEDVAVDVDVVVAVNEKVGNVVWMALVVVVIGSLVLVSGVVVVEVNELLGGSDIIPVLLLLADVVVDAVLSGSISVDDEVGPAVVGF